MQPILQTNKLIIPSCEAKRIVDRLVTTYILELQSLALDMTNILYSHQSSKAKSNIEKMTLPSHQSQI